MMGLRVTGLAALIGAGLASSAAVAAPVGYGLGPPEREAIIERVAGGCGPGFHPNPWGRCRPNDWGRGGWGGPRGGYGYGYGYRGPDRGGYGGYGRGPDGYDGPRRFYGGY